jgi:sn-glycerol 3-phosphate transport system substrate-binding protein
MSIGSTAALGAAVLAVALTGAEASRVGTGPLPAPPAPAGKEGGIILGGASMWILKRQSEEERRGAWEFLKFASQPEQQAQWYADTGYFPTRLSSHDLPQAQQRLQEYPQFTTAVDQARNSPDTPATAGALVGPFNQVRDRVKTAFEQALAGGADPVAALQSAAEGANGDLEDYNRTVD